MANPFKELGKQLQKRSDIMKKELDASSMATAMRDLKLPTNVPPPPPIIPDLRNPLVESVESNYASEFHNRLTKWISEFDASLDESHEVGARLVSFGQTLVFHLEQIGFSNPSLIFFRGCSSKSPAMCSLTN